MGLILWILAGMVTFTITRFIETQRLGWVTELSISVLAALTAGVAATAMDFGGWAVFDGRGFAFAGLTSLLCIGLIRAKRARRDS
ncbi:MAG: hypothetical protein KY432_05795 [Acidobacteria bacterium]|nr:hypothetical protein [Acidobacteriota bacterium]